jgi:MFS family permease
MDKIRAVRLGLIACLFAFVLGARWAVVDRYGMDLPEWDQWDAEGTNLLAPWYQGHLTLGVLFLPHNEHRVVLTKLVNLGLAAADGQWDQRLEAAANAILPGLIAAGLYLFGVGFLDRRWHAPLFILLGAAYGLPFAWHNVIAGFNSQQFLLIGLSFGAIAGLPAARAWSCRWWLGAACMALAMVSMASGFFAAAVVLGLILLPVLRRERSWRPAVPALLLAAALLAVGCLTRVTVPHHELAKAHTAGEFAATLLQSLEWPVRKLQNTWLIGILWLPWCLLSWRTLMRPAGAGRGPGVILLGLGAWVLLQLLATAYARGDGGYPPASRYIDTLVFGIVVNALALGWLARHGRLDTAARCARAFIALAWVGTVVGASDDQLGRILKHELPNEGVYHRYCVANVRNYLATGDEAYLRHNEIPYPGAKLLIERLLVPSLRAALPVSVRDSIPLRSHLPGGPFQQEDSRGPEDLGAASREPRPAAGLPPGMPALSNAVTWGSFAAEGSAAKGSWESDPLPAPREGWLKFEVAGQVGEKGLSLEIRDASTRRLLAEVRPDKQPEKSWRSAYVRAPENPFIVAARDDDPARWLAFSEPSEMGMLSYIAWRCVKNGLLLAEIAAGCGIVLCLGAWRAH